MNQTMNTKRRTLLKSAASVTLAVSVMPNQWTKPVINAVVLPAHGQTSFLPSCSGFETEPVNEPINITVSATEIVGPIVIPRSGNAFSGTQTNNAGICADGTSRTETIELNGQIDSATNSISGEFLVRQFCGGVLACEQITTYTVTQLTPTPGDDLGDYSGRVIGTLRCCLDFL